MILLLFILGVILIFGIARYNESNRLFWELLLSYMLGFTGAKMVYNTVLGNKVEHDNLTQVDSTQISVPTINQSCANFEICNVDTDEVVTAQVSVGQGYILVQKESVMPTGKILGRSRDQPTRKKEFFNTS